ncbi:hypothetical protein F4703DRAFT_1854574 [Phycomyces blakesleeanus]
MTASKLPSEILSQIADLLLTDDKISNAITCKAWRYPFQDSLWRDIRISSMESLQHIYNTIKTSKNTPTFHGLLVHSLRICGDYPVPNTQQDELLKFLPNLKHLDLRHIKYKDINRIMAESNDTWKSLESLIIQDITTTEPEVATDFIESLKTCRMLRNLEFFTLKRNDPILFNMNHFENLHQNLQLLSSIKAHLALNEDISSTLGTIPDTTPVLSLTSLDIKLGQWDPLWLYYFSYKYPNLHSFKLDVSDMFPGWIHYDQMQVIISHFQSNPNALRHLESFEFITKAIAEWTHLVFWEFICPLRVPVKNLKYKAQRNNGDVQLYAMTLKRFLQSFSETLETLSVDGSAFFDIKRSPTLYLSSHSPFLKDLHIESCGVSLNLDSVLNNCTALKRLRYFGGQLLNNSNTTNQDTEERQNHGLQILELRQVVTSAAVLGNISYRCRRLQYMNLSSLSISGFISEISGHLLLDMRHTFFKVLHLAQIKYYSSYKHDVKPAISMTLLSQVNYPSRSDKRNEENDEEADSKSPIISYHKIAWFHTFIDIECKKYTRIGIIQLSEQESSAAMEYYQNFKSRKDSNTIEDDPEKGWKGDLCRGYGEIRCGQVEKYTIPELSTNDKEFWENLYNKLF